MQLHIKVKPNSKTDELTVGEGGELKVKLKAPPVDGKANKYLLKFLSETFNVPVSKIEILKGHNSPHKKINIIAEEKMILEVLSKYTEQL